MQCGGRKIKFKMRISIREQLAILVLLCSLLALMVLALATWFQNFNFITNIRLSGLSLTASLKAAQVSSTLLLYQSQCQAASTRVLVQTALQRYNSGIFSPYNASVIRTDLEGAMGNGNLLIQSVVFPAVDVGNATALSGLVNVTAEDRNGTAIKLPYNYPNGSDLYLGNDEYGYPPSLYPRLTYSANTSANTADAFFLGRQLDPNDMLLLGPLIINESYALLSATIGVINNTSRAGVLGWLTVVVDASMIFDIQNSPEGLGNTGEVLILGPTRSNNRFETDPRNASADAVGDKEVRFVLPPTNDQRRHQRRSSPSSTADPFSMESFPAVVSAWTRRNGGPNNAGAYVTTKNEEGDTISAGYATLSTPFVDWVLVVEQSRGEVVAPINHLRDVVLICVFTVIGVLFVLIFPTAHYSITPIRELQVATQKTVEPYQPDEASQYSGSGSGHATNMQEEEHILNPTEAKKEGFFDKWSRATGSSPRPVTRNPRRRTFRIPSKVPERRHWITDELTDLTSTFNEMADELAMQYERLEERVKERTAELEKSKKAAEAANESKTLFIANISHELKTPLNGILGLTTVCMAEEDMSKVRSTLSTIYKSGDLLLHLLTDLLTFSKNEVGQQLAIDESEFRLIDLSTQLIPTFEKQAREAQVELKVLYLGTNDAFGNTSEFSGDKLYGPSGTGRIRDMCLWGDKNRILQVLMNFVSNSLKFTPARGAVTVRIRCVGLLEQFPSRAGSARKSSVNSRKSKNSSSKRVRMSDASLVIGNQQGDHQAPDAEKSHSNSNSGEDGKLSINVAGGTTKIAKIAERRRSLSPPPHLNTKDLAFDFEVEDTGPGIPDDQQKKIFEPFVQGDLGLSKKFGGTGLGLSICAQLASLMGGDISLDSKEGHGSKFTMRIPLRYLSERAASSASSQRSHSKASSLIGQTLHDDSEAALHHPPGGSTTSLGSSHVAHEDKYRQPGLADVPRIVGFSQPYVAKETKVESTAQARLKEMKKAESEAAKQGKKVRVLVAEDNPVNQEVVLRMLKLEDVYDVTIAKDGQEAFDTVRDSMIRGERFDLVFMDIQMPNLDGIQSTKLIREMGFSAPIVALTAFAEKSNEDECMASGMDYFLAKPIRRPALKHVLKKYCATIPEEENEGSTMAVSNPADVMEENADADLQKQTSKVAVSEAEDATPGDDVSPLS